ncbi:Na(+)-translocating NADH-quinone reductase subunit D [Rhynchospora pubera]|uniref:Na(+)-translocating NADH-quinone reductase subunit D n=1 Tax=Rhynchospora pubera TaxID=906938 RepID=A0AAV8FMN6_9POAL|nr:Na(+)-translocating NADH-quinone reductase subunit D [Rhynchospora pubera]KAJ4794279.1 Na(+)-translocating NADH-quinone reductase subunit D [Rhynchospora pubera]
MALELQFQVQSIHLRSPLFTTKPFLPLTKTLTLTSLKVKPPCQRSLVIRRPTAVAPGPGADPTSTNAQAQPLTKEQEQGGDSDAKQSVAVLKEAAKTRRVPASDILAALSKLKKSKVDPAAFFETLGGTESPGRTWMLIFTAQGRLDKGRYFPLTAIQRFDAAAKRIENGVYLGPVGNLTFEGRLSWKNRILAFIFECVRIKIGPFGPLQIDFKKEDQREPGKKDPFFIWFYVDEEIAVAQGRGGGVAFWCRCHRIT